MAKRPTLAKPCLASLALAAAIAVPSGAHASGGLIAGFQALETQFAEVASTPITIQMTPISRAAHAERARMNVNTVFGQTNYQKKHVATKLKAIALHQRH
ncbi:MAG: hypothetical protein AAF739_06420 [Pseudomonadota bacterium]